VTLRFVEHQDKVVRLSFAMLMILVSIVDGTSLAQQSLQINACALLLPAEIEQVIGHQVARGTRDDAVMTANGSYSSTCVWEVDPKSPGNPDPSAPMGGKRFVMLLALRWPSGSGLAHTFLDSFRKAAADGTIPGKPLSRNFGDEALQWGDGLAVRKGDVSFGLSVFLQRAGRPRASQRLEERLAPLILHRLEHND